MSVFYRWIAGLTFSVFALVTNADCNHQLKATFDERTVTILDGGMLVDNRTGLMWMRCSVGYSWQDDHCVRDTSQTNEFTWTEALEESPQTAAGLYNDWRLPNKNELGSIVEYVCFDPAVHPTLFPQTEPKAYWTNSPNNFNDFSAWAINFSNGDHISTSRTNLLAVRLVRSAK
jgi:Protein of unknown function (DUF1566)